MRFEGELQGGYGHISCVKNAQTLTEACWSRKASLGSGNPGHAWIGRCNYVELIDTIFTDVEGVD
jgi:hypothetical protein